MYVHVMLVLMSYYTHSVVVNHYLISVSYLNKKVDLSVYVRNQFTNIGIV